MEKNIYKEAETSVLLQYEKKKLQDCAGTLHNLASAFLIEEKEDTKDGDRKNLFLKRRLKESRVLMADHLKEIASIIQKSAEEKIKIIRLGEKKEKQIAKMLFLEGLILEDFYLLEKENGRKEVVVRLYQNRLPGKNKYYSTEDVAAFLSVLLSLRLSASAGTPYFIWTNRKIFALKRMPVIWY